MSNAGRRTVRLRILGRVQGVGYRAWATDVAADLGLRGWVRNRADGTVETLINGQAAAVAAMIEACRCGPPAACVREVVVSNADDDDSIGSPHARPRSPQGAE